MIEKPTATKFSK